jgi:hypothetical protein
MDILDIFLNKYSYKFPKGYPDMNNEQDILIMEGILSELGIDEEEDKQKEEKPDYDGEILNLLTTLSDEETKKKVISYLNKINKKEDKDEDKLEAYISEEFIKKNLSNEMIDLILLYANKTNQLQELADYVKDPIVNHSDLLNNDNLSSLFESIKLSDEFKNKLINLSGAVGNVALGKGEIALIVFIKNTEKHKSSKELKGDIKVENHVLEVKRGPSILASAGYIKRATKSNLFNSGKPEEFIKKYNIDLTKNIPWIAQITSIKADKNEIKDLIENLYSGLDIDFSSIDISNAQDLNNAIGLALAKDYLQNKDLLFINDENKYICIENYNVFKKAVQEERIKFNLASDIIPRCKLI